MSQINDILKARTFNLFLFFLIVIILMILLGIVVLIVYSAMAGALEIYSVASSMAMIFIAFPLATLQYIYLKDRLLKKILLSMAAMFALWSAGLVLTMIGQSMMLPAATLASNVFFVAAYFPIVAMLIHLLKMPESRKFDPAIGRFIALFSLFAITIIVLASAFLGCRVTTLQVELIVETIATAFDILILALSSLLILSYMPTRYRYIFAAILLGSLLFLAADGMLLLTYLGVADFSEYYQLCYAALMVLGILALIWLSLLNINPTTVEEVDKKLSDTRMQLEDIVMQSPDATALFNNDGDMIMANGQFYRLFKTPEGHKPDINLFDHVSRIRPDLKEQIMSVRNGQIIVLEDLPLHIAPQRKTPVYLSVRIFPTFTAEASISGYVTIAQDTTDRRLAEEALRRSNEELEMRVKERTSMLEQTNDALQREIEARMANEKQIKESLNEKEVLLKEIHHRVKNNLQIVSSMLSLQSSTVRDPAIVAMNLDSQSRIRSMALIHEKLYQTRNLSRIDFGEYVKSLVQFIQGSYNARHISVTIEIENIWLDIDKAIPCGLIINELFSNCLKHAFTGRDRGEVYIGMREEGDHYMLTVRDDGPGVKPGLDPSTSTSLGLSLVSALAGQLEGELVMTSRNGAEFTIWFPAGTHGINTVPEGGSDLHA